MYRCRTEEYNSTTVCPRSIDPIHIIARYYIKWVKTSRTDSRPALLSADI